MSETKHDLEERWRQRLDEIIFEADTPAAKAFDVALIVLILASVIAVMLESAPNIREANLPIQSLVAGRCKLMASTAFRAG